MYPYLSQEPAWFSFLVHPRDMKDLYRCRESAFLLERSPSEEEFLLQLAHHLPTVIGEVTFSDSAVRGELIAVGFLPQDIFSPAAQQKIIEALDLSRQRGARVIGLGGLISSATAGGKGLLPFADGLTLTNGNAYTAAAVVSQAIDAANKFTLQRPIRIGILGCTGSVGVPATRLLSEAGFELVLVGRSEIRLRNLFAGLPNSTCSSELSSLTAADIIILLTSGVDAALTHRDVSEATLIIDCTQPSNISPQFSKAALERNVSIAEGGLVDFPGFRNSLDWGFKNKQATFACLAETILFACEGLRGHSVGRPDMDFARRMERVAKRYGVSPSPIDPEVVRAMALNPPAMESTAV